MNTAGNFVDYNYNIYPLQSQIETNYNYNIDKYNGSVFKFSNDLVMDRPFKLKSKGNLTVYTEGIIITNERYNLNNQAQNFRKMYKNKNYKGIIYQVFEITQIVINDKLQNLGYNKLTHSDYQEKIWWTRKYQLIDEFQHLYLLQILKIKEKQNDDQFKNKKIIFLKEEADICIRILFSYLNSEQIKEGQNLKYQPFLKELSEFLQDQSQSLLENQFKNQ